MIATIRSIESDPIGLLTLLDYWTPLSHRETSAWMHEVGQCREQLPRVG